MTLHPIQAVRITCDGCGCEFDAGGDFAFFAPEDVPQWLDAYDWQEVDGKHYCMHEKVPDCFPPGHFDDEDDDDA